MSALDHLIERMAHLQAESGSVLDQLREAVRLLNGFRAGFEEVTLTVCRQSEVERQRHVVFLGDLAGASGPGGAWAPLRKRQPALWRQLRETDRWAVELRARLLRMDPPPKQEAN